jgi:hypothetical protein
VLTFLVMTSLAPSVELVGQLRQDLVDIVALVGAAHTALDSIPRDLRRAVALTALALDSAEAALARADAAAAHQPEPVTSSTGDQH